MNLFKSKNTLTINLACYKVEVLNNKSDLETINVIPIPFTQQRAIDTVLDSAKRWDLNYTIIGAEIGTTKVTL